MKTKKRIWPIVLISVLLLIVLLVGFYFSIPYLNYGFSRAVSPEEEALRLTVVEYAESWLGANESDGSHHPIVDLYNSFEPLAQGYTVTYEDNWCATFGSAVAIHLGLTDIIPTECGCQRQIGLFDAMGRWEEDDSYLPLPGDYIFYAWDDNPIGDCTGWADHVGIVVGTWGPFIKVIEGNKSDAVGYRILLRDDPTIRGFGLPDYAAK